MGMYTDCSSCKNLLSAGGHCYYYDYLTDHSVDSLVYKYYLGHEDATNCDHFESKNGSSGSSGCFLTSALVRYLGKPDDCEELQTLRHFRDTVLKRTPKGAKLVIDYYKVAPKIVEKIESSENKDEHYCYINDIVNMCLNDIKKGDNEAAIEHYQGMVNHLKLAFNL